MKQHEHMRELEARLYDAIPALDPPPPYWLSSDASASYCRSCAIKARGLEFDLGAPIKDEPFYRRDEWEQAFWQGIDGGFDTMPSDSAEHCETCGITLAYTLTEYGIADELAHFAEHPGFAVSILPAATASRASPTWQRLIDGDSARRAISSSRPGQSFTRRRCGRPGGAGTSKRCSRSIATTPARCRSTSWKGSPPARWKRCPVAKRKRSTTAILVDPNPADVMTMQLRWSREQHGVSAEHDAERARQLIATRARPKKP